MSDLHIRSDSFDRYTDAVPETIDGAIDPAWLSRVLTHLSAGYPVHTVELVEVIKAMAAKLRVAISFEGAPDDVYRLCIKGFLDHDQVPAAANITNVREARFYADIARRVEVRVPPCAAVVMHPDGDRAIFIMADMIAAGTHFYNALDELGVDQVAQTLDQLARLHARTDIADDLNWLPNRITELARRDPVTPWNDIQELMHDGRGDGLPGHTLRTDLLRRGMARLAECCTGESLTLLHGDSHPGNIYRTHDALLGFTDWQLVQRGHWSLDVAYHIASVLPADIAEREERALLNHYLGAVQRHGGSAESGESAWLAYRRSLVYGYFHWAITRRVDPRVTRQTFHRLGAAVARHDSYRLLEAL